MADFESIEQRLERIEDLLQSLQTPERIEDLLQSLQTPERQKYFYTTNEAAERLGKSTWYIRRLCSLGEIVAEKHPESGRFLISADEIDRIETRRGALDD